MNSPGCDSSLSGPPDGGRQDSLTPEDGDNEIDQMRALVDGLATADLMERIRRLRTLELSINKELDATVTRAREARFTWSVIARAASMTRQAAYGRWDQGARARRQGRKDAAGPQGPSGPQATSPAQRSPAQSQERREQVRIQVGPFPLPGTLTVSRKEVPPPGTGPPNGPDQPTRSRRGCSTSRRGRGLQSRGTSPGAALPPS